MRFQNIEAPKSMSTSFGIWQVGLANCSLSERFKNALSILYIGNCSAIVSTIKKRKLDSKIVYS